MRFLDGAWGVGTYFQMNPGQQSFTIKMSQDVEPILDSNAYCANHTDGFNKDRDFMRRMSIPQSLAEHWLNEDRAAGRPPWRTLPRKERDEYLAKRLADHSKLRTYKKPQPYQRPMKDTSLIDAVRAGR